MGFFLIFRYFPFETLLLSSKLFQIFKVVLLNFSFSNNSVGYIIEGAMDY